MFKGEPIAGIPTYQIVQRGICRSHQEIRLFRRLKVEENVYVGLPNQRYENLLTALFRRSFKRSKEREENLGKVHSLLTASKILPKKNFLAGSLSYGEQKFVMMSRILATGAELVLLDEPTAGLDGEQINDVLSSINRLVSENKTVIVVEHNIDVIMSISDYIFVLDQGSKVAEGEPKDIYQDERVLETYLGER